MTLTRTSTTLRTGVAPSASSIATSSEVSGRFTDGAGNPVELVGMKDVGDDPGMDLWKDTTTLFTRICSGHEAGLYEATSNPVLAEGVITIAIDDFVEQLSTFRGNPLDIARFVYRFNQTLGSVYLKG